MSDDPSLLGGGDPAPADPNPADPNPSDPQPAPAGISFYGEDGQLHSSITEQIGDMKGTQNFFQKYSGAENPTLEALKGIENLTAMVGQKTQGLTRPAEDASDAEKQAYVDQIRKLNGTPDNADDYGYVRPEDLDESIPFEVDEAKAFADVLHQHHASPELAKALFDVYTEQLKGVPEAIAREEAAYKQEQVTALRDEFGAAADKTIQQAKDNAATFGVSEDLMKQIGMSAEGVKFLAGLSKYIGADSIPSGNGEGAMNNGKNYEQMAMEAGQKAMEANSKGDNVGYQRHRAEQQKYQQLMINQQNRGNR